MNVLNTLTLNQISWKTRNIFKKLEYCFLVKSTKIENASFSYKTAISEVNVKIKKMLSTKWTCHKERSFASNYFFFFWKFCFSLRTSSKELIWCANDPNAHIRTFCKCWSFIWGYFFTVSILKTNLFFSLICGQHFLIYSFVLRMIVTARGVYRTLSNIYDGDFLRKKIAGFRRFVPNFATDRENRALVGSWV